MTIQELRQTETPKKLSKRRLTDRLVKLIFNGHTDMTENAQVIGIGRATAYRYWNDWIDSEEAQQLDVEWWAFFQQLKDKSPIRAFEGLTRLKVRKTPQHIEEKVEVKEEVAVNITSILAQYSGAINSAVKRDIDAIRAEQQMDTADSQTATT